jgi:hypothetical protein
MKILILLISLLISFPVYSGQFVIHTFTTHVGVEGLEEYTPGLAYTNNKNFRLGILRNSFKLPSMYAVKLFPVSKRFKFGVGLISGYTYFNGTLIKGPRSIVPLVAAELDITKNVGVVWAGNAFNLVLKY